MSFTYCKSCGYKNVYSLQPPNFCASCGEPMAQSTNKVMAKNKNIIKHKIDDEEGEDIFEVPNVSRLKYQILNAKSSARKFKLSELAPGLNLQTEDQSSNEPQEGE